MCILSIFAYERINPQPTSTLLHTQILNQISLLESLLSTKPVSTAWHIQRIHAAVEIGWTFDYCAKSYDSPVALLECINSLIRKIIMFEEMDQSSIFIDETSDASELDKWQRANRGFNFFWPKNTSGDNFDELLIIAKKRLEQMVEQFPDLRDKFNSAKVLDVGCGPGRYMYELSTNYNIESAHGIDSGEGIINTNKKRFESNSTLTFSTGTCRDLSEFEDSSFDIVLSNGVIHHSGEPLDICIAEHSRVLKEGGKFFVFVYGDGGLELRIWEAMQNILDTVTMELFYDYCSKFIVPKRLQGLMDHAYGSFYYTSRDQIEGLLKANFSDFKRVKGVFGMDITEELYSDYPYFKEMFGSGMHRYLCTK